MLARSTFKVIQYGPRKGSGSALFANIVLKSRLAIETMQEISYVN